MLFVKTINIVLGNVSKVTILRHLTQSSTPVSGRELARNIGLSHVKCHHILQELSKHGIIIMRQAGNSILYQINPKHILYKKILSFIFTLESQFFKELGDIVIKNLQRKPVSLILFGSIITNQAEPDSDIDLLLVMPPSKSRHINPATLQKIELTVLDLFGNQLSPLVTDPLEFRKKIRQKDPLFLEILTKGRVIYGKSLAELL